MSGAYTARAAATAASTTPPGWTVGWAFPGVWPPGYVPTLSYTLVTGETYVPGATHDATATLYDQVTYETRAPDNPMFWTATMNGVVVGLKLDGDAEWSEILETDHSVIGSYGAEPTLRFNVSEDEDGEIIILRGVSTPFNDAVAPDEVEAEIEVVVEQVYTATVRCDVTANALSEAEAGLQRSYGFRLTMKETDNSPIAYAWVQPQRWVNETEFSIATLGVWPADQEDFTISASIYDDETAYEDEDWFEDDLDNYAGLISAVSISEEMYTVNTQHEATLRTITQVVYTYTFKLYINDELSETVEKVVTKSSGDPFESNFTEWLQLNGETGEITIINP